MTWTGGHAGLRVRETGRNKSEVVPLVGSTWCYRATGERCCPGTRKVEDDGSSTLVDCTNRPGKGSKCERCSTIDTVFAANMHQAHKLGRSYVDNRFAAHLEQPHRLYLAVFADGSLKVGTTAGSAGGVRLAEQGAWLARYVALASDGYRVRELEDAVSERLGIGQAVVSSRKLAGLVNPVPTARLSSSIATLASRVHEMIGDDPSLRDGCEVIDIPWSFAGVDTTTWSGLDRYPNRIDVGSHDFVITDVCGRFAVLERIGWSNRFVVDLGQLGGIVVDVGDHVPDPVEIQASLF